jgi:O-acetyl-ADP-ribose deacetylase (regulator of RNase III)
MNYKLIEGDILECDIQYIAHQCNCVSTGAAGLAYYLFNKFPFSDIYSNRIKKIYDPGSIIVSGDGNNSRYVINMFSQFFPGNYSEKDTLSLRESYFKECLNKILLIEGIQEIAFPYKIGCGLAGGNWEIYEKMIDDFSYYNSHLIEVYIYKRKEDN